jgi:hypothetical protein
MRLFAQVPYDSGNQAEGHTINLNDLSDPLAAEGAQTFTGYDQMIALYKSYVVTGGTVKLWYEPNSQAEDMVSYYRIGTSNMNVLIAPYGHMDGVVVRPIKQVSDALPWPSYRAEFSTARVAADSLAAKPSVSNTFSADNGVTPTDLIQLFFVVETADGSTALTNDGSLWMQIDVDVIWFGPRGEDSQ